LQHVKKCPIGRGRKKRKKPRNKDRARKKNCRNLGDSSAPPDFVKKGGLFTPTEKATGLKDKKRKTIGPVGGNRGGRGYPGRKIVPPQIDERKVPTGSKGEGTAFLGPT